jgi:hypothetical protein
MGYRSDVVNAIAFDGKDKLFSFLTECRLNNVIDKEGLDCYQVKVHKYKPYIDEVAKFVYILHAEFNDVKWYESYSGVKQHVDMRELANTKGFPTCYLRIGEDLDDIDQIVFAEHDTEETFEFFWWDYGYEVERSFCLDRNDTTLTMQDFLKTNRSSDDGQQPETSESQDTVSA